MKGVLDPVSDRLGDGLGPLSGIVGTGLGALLAAEAGALSGFLAGRVLGQYEFPVLDPEAPARLLFVAPNLGHAASQLDAEPDQLLRWVALHESTHALQFGAVPWLRGHLAACVRELLGGMTFEGGSLLKIPDLADLKGLADRVREDGIATLALGPERRELFDGMQALMAVLEGYAEHVMDAVGGDVLDDLPALRGALNRRRRERSGFLRAVRAPDRHGPQAAPVRAGQAVLRRRRRPRRHRGAQPRLGLPRGHAHARRARRSRRLDRPHRAPRPRCVTRVTRTSVRFRVTPAEVWFTNRCSQGMYPAGQT